VSFSGGSAQPPAALEVPLRPPSGKKDGGRASYRSEPWIRGSTAVHRHRLDRRIGAEVAAAARGGARVVSSGRAKMGPATTTSSSTRQRGGTDGFVASGNHRRSRRARQQRQRHRHLQAGRATDDDQRTSFELSLMMRSRDAATLQYLGRAARSSTSVDRREQPSAGY
jgi:hypothetical protein